MRTKVTPGKACMILGFILIMVTLCAHRGWAQDRIGISTSAPAGKLHIEGTANISQLVIDASVAQTNQMPLIRLRDSSDVDILWINAHGESNIFMGVGAGQLNTGINNCFIGGNSGHENEIGSYNTGIGYNTLYANQTGIFNSAVGTFALRNNTTGQQNTAIGYSSQYLNIDGGGNTSVGFVSLRDNTVGNGNVAMGWYALESNVAGSNNVAIGTECMNYSNNTSEAFDGQNVAVGYAALRGSQNPANNTGSKNTALGYRVLFNNTTGSFNVGTGVNSLLSNTSGNNNSAYGALALQSNTSGTSNAAFGYQSLKDNTTGSENIAIGLLTLSTNKAGSRSIAIGPNAMQNANNTTTGIVTSNIGIGYEALKGHSTPSQNTGIQNIAIGSVALKSTTTGSFNTAVGSGALQANTTGPSNVSVGAQSMEDNIDGGNNAAVGNLSMLNNTSGSANTAVGAGSMSGNITGSNNTAIGRNAYFFSANLSNTTAIGYNSGGVVEASNRIEIGNSSVSWVGGQMNWGTYSDGRIKDNIREDVPGLAFITQLRPVTYNLNIHRANEMTGQDKGEAMDWTGKYDIEQLRISGFIAQEVEAAASELRYDFSGVQKPPKEEELYSLRYAEFVVPLVKSVQELSEENNALKARLAEQETALEELTARMEELIGSVIGDR